MTLDPPIGSILEGACNFRDCGGLPADNGSIVRSGLVFRSNRLSQLTGGDHTVLDGLSIAAVFDLRSKSEREQDPTSWRPPNVVTHVFTAGHKRRLIDMALDYEPTRAGSLALMRDFYGEMPFTMGHVFGDMLLRIAAGALPCVIHCSAGKDRTGVAVAILLAALGVPRGAIVDDYVRSASITALEADMARAMTAGEREHMLARYPADAIAAVMDASAEYIGAALDAIDDRCGSLGDYLNDKGISASTLGLLRSRLTVAADGETGRDIDG